MKVKFTSSNYYSNITLNPETIEEVSQLVRTAKNAKKVPIRMTVYFYEDGSVHCSIAIQKKEVRNQINSINNR